MSTENQLPDESTVLPSASDTALASAKTLTLVVYVLQVAGFFIGITFLVAVILNYVKKDEVAGTWLASHFRWQIRTFWFCVLWSVVGFIGMYFLIGFFILMANGVWVIYRVAKGWLRLNDNKPMYVA